jgi:hypothetical protein
LICLFSLLNPLSLMLVSSVSGQQQQAPIAGADGGGGGLVASIHDEAALKRQMSATNVKI